MKYTILTLGNPERQQYMDIIRNQMSNHEEVFIPCVDGKTKQLDDAIDKYGFDIAFDEWRPGEGGVWYSNINAWSYAAENNTDLMIFEDDAVLSHHFGRIIDRVTLPEEYDFVTFYLPYFQRNQLMPFSLIPAYQQHGNVCVLYSSTGAKKILGMLESEGLEWPVDIWLYKKALSNQLTGFGPHNLAIHIVTVDYEVPSNIHDDDRIEVHKHKDNE